MCGYVYWPALFMQGRLGWCVVCWRGEGGGRIGYMPDAVQGVTGGGLCCSSGQERVQLGWGFLKQGQLYRCGGANRNGKAEATGVVSWFA